MRGKGRRRGGLGEGAQGPQGQGEQRLRGEGRVWTGGAAGAVTTGGRRVLLT